MSDFIGNLLLTSVMCSVIVLIVLAISPLLKKYTKKWRYVVFILIAVKLLLPMPFYTAENAIVIPVAKEVDSATNKVKNTFVTSGNVSAVKENTVNQNSEKIVYTQENDTQVENVKNDTVANSEKQPVNTENVKAEATENILASFITKIDMDIVYMVLFGIWCLGVIGFGLFYILMYFYHRKNLNRWSTNITDENMLAILEAEKARLGITKNIVIKKCKKINTPMTLGFRHLSIVLPYTEYSEGSIRYIFRHELTHQKRHDIYAKVLFIASKCLHWFNPIVPLMVNRAYDDMEILCDDMVVADMQKEQRIEYNEIILNIAKAKAEEVTGKNILFAFCFVEKESNLKERVKNIMTMGKRKKGYQIVALAMAVIVAGSCFISCGNKTEKVTEKVTEKTAEVTDDYNEYLREVLVPQYGLADLSNFNTNIKANEYNSYYYSDRKINLEGIASAYIDDMNADGVEDMIVVRFQVGAKTAKTGKMFDMVISAYTIKDNKIKLLDEEKVGAHHCKSIEDEFWQETIAEKELADANLYVSAVTDGKNKYIFLESVELMQAFGDGIYEYYSLYQLDGEELKISCSIEQDYVGSAGFKYTGYVGDEKTLLYNANSGMEGEEKGLYDTYVDAVEGYFEDLNIFVKAIENKYEEKRYSIISDDSLVNKIFSYEWSSSDYNWENASAVFTQTAQDYTNVLDIIGVSSEETAKKTTEAGTSEEAMEVFEKIQTDENYAGHLFLAAVELDHNYSEEIKEETYYYWKSIGTTLAATGIEYSFEGYDVQYVNDSEKNEVYHVLEPKVVESIGKVFTGSIWPETTIPYDNPEFAEQEPGAYTYPYEITYKEDEDKYYVRYGELGSVYFTDCKYTVNDDDTMTITGKYTNSDSNPDEYLIDNYEITVGYDPDNEIYGFTIIDVKEL